MKRKTEEEIPTNDTAKKIKLTSEKPEVVDPITHLTASFITSKYLPREADTNVAFSPYSISSAMLMTSAGASGSTLHEMHSSLFPSGGDPHQYFKEFTEAVAKNPVIAVANTVFLDKDNTVCLDFQHEVKTNYDSDIQFVPFRSNPSSSSSTINKWVEAKTQGKIQKLLSEEVIKEDTRLVLVNAIYFKAAWRTQFDKKNTTDLPFHLIDNKKELKVPTMIKKAHFGVKEGEKATLIELPYKEQGFSMVIVLPKDNSQESWDAITSKEHMACLGKLGDIGSEEVVLHLPKFKISWKAELTNYMQEMGVKTAFTESADFSKMINQKEPLCIGAVIHEAVVEVDENGTEAAAATAVAMKLKSRAGRPKEIHVDHPFFFYIRHNTSHENYTTIFAGYVKNF
eukprot:TRINITY_DN1578_c0_g2_i5.p1 TRINITY_DN1578_c0_g2~~TRINITY_DN1578_c0_g2_i5.p1  ORF type:complete len:398 (+),score=97.32 TRINITY_DN1578_c0_g2_i5:120-1313(+)